MVRKQQIKLCPTTLSDRHSSFFCVRARQQLWLASRCLISPGRQSIRKALTTTLENNIKPGYTNGNRGKAKSKHRFSSLPMPCPPPCVYFHLHRCPARSSMSTLQLRDARPAPPCPLSIFTDARPASRDVKMDARQQLWLGSRCLISPGRQGVCK